MTDKIVSIVDRNVARIVREHYDDPEAAGAILRRYHPSVTEKEVLAACYAVDKETVLRSASKEFLDLCWKPGGADLKGMFEILSTRMKHPPGDDFWNFLETIIPPDQARWLRRQLELASAQKP